MKSPNTPKLPVHLESRAQEGQKLISPSAQRNSEAIGHILQDIIPQNAHVLEIASGTGQHGAHMCSLRPDIMWQMSDIDELSLVSQNVYINDYPTQMPPSLTLNMTEDNWWQGMPKKNAIFCANMIHISPWAATLGLVRGAKNLLKKNGLLCVYGPFLLETGSAPSNVEFDMSLKRRNPEWGVRTLESVKHIFADSGLNLASTMKMPKNNLLLIFKLNS